MTIGLAFQITSTYAALVGLAFVVTYAVLAPWWRSAVGWNLMLTSGALTVAFAMLAAVAWTGPLGPAPWVIVLSILAGTLTQRLVLLLTEHRRGRGASAPTSPTRRLAMPKHLATTTQQQHPARASWRTAVQTAIGVLITAGVVIPLIADAVNAELGQYLPDNWEAWLVGAGAAAAAVSAAVARVMAIPAIDARLKRLGLASSPDA